MTTAQQLVGLLYKRGAALSVEDGDLLIDAPDDALDDDLLALIRESKAEMIALIESLDADGASSAAPAKQARAFAYDVPASLAQERMLFMEELAGGSSYYNIPTAYRIDGALDKGALLASLAHLVASHDVLRCVVVRGEQGYIQRVCDPSAFSVVEQDLSAHADPAASMEALLREEADHRFDLEREWPVRVMLIALAERTHVLSLNIHHIAADGWSARKIVDDIGAGYRLCHGAYGNVVDSDAMDKLQRGYQYADYVEWQTAWLESARCAEARRYWIDALEGMPQLHSLSTDFNRPRMQSVAGETYVHAMPETLRLAVEQGAQRFRTTPFVIFQSAFAALLARYSGESDIVFGTAASNRRPEQFVDTVGLFVNTLVLRYSVTDGLPFSSLVNQAIAVSDGAFRHQQLPFDVLVDELQPPRSLGYNPLVQIMLVMQDNAAGALALQDAEVTRLEQRQGVSKFDIALHIHAGQHDAQQIAMHWEYNTSLFRRDTIAAMAAHFQNLLAACLAQPEIEVDAVVLMNTDALLQAVDATRFPAPQCIHRLIEARAALHPHAVAASDASDPAKSLSYGELDRRAELLAAHLRQAGGKAPRTVGLCMEKSVELVIGLLAIFKTGATYVPLDPHYPKERLEFMIADAGLEILLTSRDTTLPPGLETSAVLLQVETLADGPQREPRQASADDPDLPAYIIYTSGSTGKPKGVLVSHRALFHSLHANAALMQFDAADVMPAIGSQAFGVSILEILLPLTSGGEVRILKKSQVTDMQELVRATGQVTILHAVPSLMRQWLDAVIEDGATNPYPRLRLLLVGGESVPDQLLKKIKQWRPEIRLLELYGMTESTVVCSSYEAGAATHAHYCIGKPHPNARFHVLSRRGLLQPAGVPGELHIGGLSIALGYVNQPDMTKEKFLADAFGAGRIYKTGDRVRLLQDGNHEFLGRVDHQVSLRGARIEMGEIEMLAGAVEGVKQAVAHVVDLGADESTLVLHYTAVAAMPDQEKISAALRAHFAQHLPDYMRPSIIERLDAFPLNPNGKVDRKKLPRPQVSQAAVEPASNIERRLLDLWRSVLLRDDIGVTSDFFSVGGHSLMATRLAGKIRAEFSVALPLTEMFASPTVRACAAYIDNALREKFAASLILADDDDIAEGDELLI